MRADGHPPLRGGGHLKLSGVVQLVAYADPSGGLGADVPGKEGEGSSWPLGWEGGPKVAETAPRLSVGRQEGREETTQGPSFRLGANLGQTYKSSATPPSLGKVLHGVSCVELSLGISNWAFQRLFRLGT